MANITNYWNLPSAKQQEVKEQVIPAPEQECECLDLTPVKPGDKYVYCVECHAVYEIITPYVMHRLKTVED